MNKGIPPAAWLRLFTALLLLGAVYASPIRERGPSARVPRRAAAPNFLRRCFAPRPWRAVTASTELASITTSYRASTAAPVVRPTDRGFPSGRSAAVATLLVPRCLPARLDPGTPIEVTWHQRC